VILAVADSAAVVTGVAACATDIPWRRIPNVLTFGSALAGFGWHLWTGGLAGFGWSVVGWAAGVAMLLPLYLLRSLGAGDVKLLGSFGAWLGPADVVWAALYGTMAGGVLALLVALTSGYLGTASRNVLSLLMFWRPAGV